MKMRKLYGVLLLMLFAVSSVWPQEHPTPPDQTKGFFAWVQKKYLHTTSTIKRQYQDKHKRRVWLSSGAACLISFLSWKLGAFQRIWRGKSKPRDKIAAAVTGTPQKAKPSKNVLEKPALRPGQAPEEGNSFQGTAHGPQEEEEDENGGEWPNSIVVNTDPNTSLAPYTGPTDGAADAKEMGKALQAKPITERGQSNSLALRRKAREFFARRSEEGLPAKEAQERAEEDFKKKKERARKQFQQGATQANLQIVMDAIKAGASVRGMPKLYRMIFELSASYDLLSEDEQLNLAWLIQLCNPD